MDSNQSPDSDNPLAKKVNKIINFELDHDTLNALKNVSSLVPENNLTTRRNLRANIEKQSLLINEQFIGAFQDAYNDFQKLCDFVSFIDGTCKKMMSKIEELKFQTFDFMKQTNEVNEELQKLDKNEKVLNTFLKEFKLEQAEIDLISNTSVNITINDKFFEILNKIKLIHEKAKCLLANNQYITGFEIMDSMSKFEEMANDKLYRWTISILRTVNLDIIELHPHLFQSISYLQSKDVLFKYCMDEYTTVRRSAVSHQFIEALTRGRTSNNTNYPAIELYSHDNLRYIGDILSFLHQTIVFEKDMINTLLKLCDQQKLSSENVVKNILSSITEGLIRPLKIRIENSLISNNKNLLKTNERQKEKTKNYFLVKNLINFYLHTFGQILLEESAFLILIKEMLILSDKVFYNSLNFYCSTKISEKLSNTTATSNSLNSNNTFSLHLNEFLQLIDELLECVKSSMFSNIEEQKLETNRILSSSIDPFMQYVIIYSTKLSSIEVTVFTFNCIYSLNRIINKYKHTETFTQNLQKQLDDSFEVLVNEQFQFIINNLSISSFYNVIIPDENLSVPLSSFSGCDPLAISNFLKLWDKFMNDPKQLQLPQLAIVQHNEIRDKIWKKSLNQIANAYRIIYKFLTDPNNQYTDTISSISHKPDDVEKFLNKLL